MPPTRKHLGQHFLHDLTVLQKISDVIAICKEDQLVEIGPGRGALTQVLLAAGAHLDAIEIDRDLIDYLQQIFANNKNFHLHQADVLKFDFSTLLQTDKKLRIMGNLPYNISTPLLFKLFALQKNIVDMHFMLQKEVVLRLTAAPGDSNYGRLSVMAQYFCDCTLLFNVSAQAFSPPPQVESAFVRLVPHSLALSADNFENFSHLVREAFNYRRKTLANALKRFVNADQLIAVGIDPTLRPQELTVADFVKISKIVEDGKKGSS